MSENNKTINGWHSELDSFATKIWQWPYFIGVVFIIFAIGVKLGWSPVNTLKATLIIGTTLWLYKDYVLVRASGLIKQNVKRKYLLAEIISRFNLLNDSDRLKVFDLLNAKNTGHSETELHQNEKKYMQFMKILWQGPIEEIIKEAKNEIK